CARKGWGGYYSLDVW
nr:immunoglobulin heavy chain junction region [Macaca mulatta]MOW86560.1 immunoglobulin heavy chain junction region [Macaca mulatta]MOW86584.1 immunoglobulin heavy chain junction region [Macaca mulatta]MOW86826.1 immunoglobulin heavy chain junction region [Macaca mulatta]MOW87650.1 immunoglobulin heavy chain junction region [Macaca mulatta]